MALQSEKLQALQLVDATKAQLEAECEMHDKTRSELDSVKAQLEQQNFELSQKLAGEVESAEKERKQLNSQISQLKSASESQNGLIRELMSMSRPNTELQAMQKEYKLKDMYLSELQQTLVIEREAFRKQKSVMQQELEKAKNEMGDSTATSETEYLLASQLHDQGLKVSSRVMYSNRKLSTISLSSAGKRQLEEIKEQNEDETPMLHNPVSFINHDDKHQSQAQRETNPTQSAAEPAIN